MSARARRPEDWVRDVAAARDVESQVAAALRADGRLVGLEDHTHDFAALDFCFRYRGGTVRLDVKEKRQPYSAGITKLWPAVPGRHLFVVDETVYRRIVWQGGGGYLAIHDLPEHRWVYFRPWELTLGLRQRYARWGRRRDRPFLKGKLLVDLRAGAEETVDFDTAALPRTIEVSRAWRDRIEPYPIHGARLGSSATLTLEMLEFTGSEKGGGVVGGNLDRKGPLVVAYIVRRTRRGRVEFHVFHTETAWSIAQEGAPRSWVPGAFGRAGP